MFLCRYYVDKETRRRVAKNESLTRIVRECCKGYTGDECDHKMDVTEPITCGNMTCDADPNVYCARVKKCGKEISIFLDENGVPSKKCNHTYDLESISCNGVCREDPCLNAECPGYPSATCFPMGCECKAVWLIHNPYTRENLEVVCGSEGSRNTRQKRQSSCNSWMTSFNFAYIKTILCTMIQSVLWYPTLYFYFLFLIKFW